MCNEEAVSLLLLIFFSVIDSSNIGSVWLNKDTVVGQKGTDALSKVTSSSKFPIF